MLALKGLRTTKNGQRFESSCNALASESQYGAILHTTAAQKQSGLTPTPCTASFRCGFCIASVKLSGLPTKYSRIKSQTSGRLFVSLVGLVQINRTKTSQGKHEKLKGPISRKETENLDRSSNWNTHNWAKFSRTLHEHIRRRNDELVRELKLLCFFYSSRK